MHEHVPSEDYNSEPVKYCSKCYSLKIGYEDTIGSEYCMDCGCSDTMETSIEEWENLYTRRYGNSYIDKKADIRKSPIFQMSIESLKLKIYDSPAWEKIIRHLYPGFPRGLSRADSVILFFNHLIKDGRLNDLRLLLYNNKY